MAELNVQPKKPTSMLPWIVLILGAIALIWFLTRDKSGDEISPGTGDTTGRTLPTAVPDNTRTDWNDVDFAAPGLVYDEVTNPGVEVRGNNEYGIYALDETILFDEGKAVIRKDAEAALTEIASSVSKRYSNALLRVYGHTDSQGSVGANKELAAERAEAVKNWLQTNGMESARISINAIGEEQPVAPNNTQQGRQANRRVEIVARKA